MGLALAWGVAVLGWTVVSVIVACLFSAVARLGNELERQARHVRTLTALQRQTDAAMCGLIEERTYHHELTRLN